VPGLPAGGSYYLSAIVWSSTGIKSESVGTTAVTVTGGAGTDVAVAID
jgi:hypothetical protein